MSWTVWIPLMATIVAAAMAFVTGTLLERSKRRHSLRNEAYAEYLSAVARSTSAPPSDRSKVLTDAALAKCKIVIHGSDRVIEALKAFELCGAVSSSEEGQDGLLDLVVAIRGSVGVDRNDLRVLLLGEQPQKPQPSPLPEWPHAPPYGRKAARTSFIRPSTSSSHCVWKTISL